MYLTQIVGLIFIFQEYLKVENPGWQIEGFTGVLIPCLPEMNSDLSGDRNQLKSKIGLIVQHI